MSRSKRKILTAFWALAAVTLLSSLAWAQPPIQGPPPPGLGQGQHPPHGAMRQEDPERGFQRVLLRHLYPVEMVRRHAEELKLTDAQVKKLKKVVTDVGTEVEQLKWDLTDQAGKLAKLVEKGASKEQIYEQLDRIFVYENKIKKKQLGLLIVIRDVLTPKQKKFLDDVKKQHMPFPPSKK